MHTWHEDLLNLLVTPAACSVDVFASIERVAFQLGFEHVAFGFQSPYPVTQPKITLFNNYSQPWQEHYSKAGYPNFSTLGDLSRLPFERFIEGLARALEPLTDAPMVFVGGCFGSVLAYETACRMVCPPLGMVFIGSGAPTSEGPAPTYHLMTDEQLKQELTRMKSMPDHLLGNDEYLAPVFLALRGMSQLAASYRPKLLALPDCAMTSIWPRSDVTVSKHDMIAWNTLTTGRFTLAEIDGSHAVLMDDPLGTYEASGLRDLLHKLTSGHP